jgi:hypothetical protein
MAKTKPPPFKPKHARSSIQRMRRETRRSRAQAPGGAPLISFVELRG